MSTRADRVAELHSAVLDWYASNGRDLAFRRTTDPWAILVSEVMAQQTQAARAAEAWSRFIAAFPTPAALAAASPAAVIRAWRGLGYNRRAIALHAAARAIVEQHDGTVPQSLEALLDLPGIGPYTARAVLALAFDAPVAALDVNIRRVLARVGLIGTPNHREFQAAADTIVPTDTAAAWTHALMDIGAAFCRPREPHCDACPLRTTCAFAAQASSEPGTSAAAPTGTKPGVRARPAPFAATSRWLRGRIVDRLRDAPDGAWTTIDGPIGQHAPADVERAIRKLAGEGLLELDRSGSAQTVRLVTVTATPG